MRFLFLIALTFAQLKVPGWTVNPALELNVTAMSSGQIWQGSTAGMSVKIKVTRLTSESAARDLAKVEYANVYHLYDERGNPYQGQISQLIICDKKFRPQVKKIKILGQEASAIFAGANVRQVLGACNSDQITNWAVYFNIITPDGFGVIAVRMFRPISSPELTKISEATAQLKRLAPQLLVPDKS